ncbi:hypothetical protein BaRGS_00032078 [Batillaria attramentaria]|uniref:Uncharacterized protein n=1 Tax=Batillaria attramentaria TaxID=370345 RepID=A0ABD0JPN7_9CAEN
MRVVTVAAMDALVGFTHKARDVSQLQPTNLLGNLVNLHRHRMPGHTEGIRGYGGGGVPVREEKGDGGGDGWGDGAVRSAVETTKKSMASTQMLLCCRPP